MQFRNRAVGSARPRPTTVTGDYPAASAWHDGPDLRCQRPGRQPALAFGRLGFELEVLGHRQQARARFVVDCCEGEAKADVALAAIILGTRTWHFQKSLVFSGNAIALVRFLTNFNIFGSSVTGVWGRGAAGGTIIWAAGSTDGTKSPAWRLSGVCPLSVPLAL